ncbi:MAG: TatD family hydrolase [Bacteroidales bacterium]|nr:TatD family hydrolase [Bacteroidales bacterium]
MTIIDTHCHLIDEAFVADTAEVINNAFENNVNGIVLACCSAEEFKAITALCQQYPNNLFPTVGIHPENMEDDIATQWSNLKTLAEEHLQQNKPLVAVGEIGIDLHWDKTRLDDQKRLLQWQCDWAVEHQLPVLLHIRDAMDEWLEWMDNYQHKNLLRGVLHCYSGNIEQAKKALELGDWYFGIGGTLTYKKSLVPEVAKAIGLDRIVLETDAPYLAPVPYRGKRNEPAYTSTTAKALATLLEIPLEEVAQKTTANAQKLLGLD